MGINDLNLAVTEIDELEALDAPGLPLAVLIIIALT
jgi:hypothetical protein